MPFKNIHIDLNIDSSDIQQEFSLSPVIAKIKTISEDASYGTKLLAKELLHIIEENHVENLSVKKDSEKFKPIFEIISNLSGDINFSTEEPIAFGFPVPDKLIFSSSNLQELSANGLKFYEGETNCDTINTKNLILYNLILERFYGINSIETDYIFESSFAGYTKYYELKIDFSFVDIQYQGTLPKIDLAAIRDNKFHSYDALNDALAGIDLSKFKFEGLSILRFKNRDKEFIIKRLQDIIKNVNIKNKESLKEELNSIFRSIIHKNDLDFFFLPIFELSGFPISENEYAKKSILLGEYMNHSIACSLCSIYSYLSEPIIWSYGIDQDLNINDQVFIQILKDNGITNYLGIPLFHTDRFVGFIEIYSKHNNFDKNDALKLKPYLPHFAQLSNDFVAYLKNQLNNIILQNYTSIQPALQWRFNEVAVSYFSQLNSNKETAKLDKIIFKDVYPIYGAVDIKDSTRIRNAAQKQTLLHHLESLKQLYEELITHQDFDYLHCYGQNFENAYQCIHDKGIEKNIVNLRTFLEKKVPIFLAEIKPKLEDNVKLLITIDEIERNNTLILDPNNDPFEKSLRAFTQMIKSEYDDLNKQLQSIFPCYFETFRTDGVEYDAYIGQSITPTSTFRDEILHEMCKHQILSMIRVVQKARTLSTDLPLPLKTTQLLFVHPEKISISFREDEKRFDVEGGYNIRYQIIKKRIDKALIENTKERLVQPETIAIVFSNEYIKDDIQKILEEIILSGLIEKDYEFLTLEELQGVSELRAIRVKVI
ncbi:hypothetical protein [Sphingobacterium litopenaei]|uniref:GAF domain-containing protein n=1 Tax=Sphingobacterium litopenaei TaxID=2763500 RepID=A0ABR7YDM2_9SPHI|nr:hypothetical protein [Sphingobacterium litopenaei]MBD1429391.1 hypothetical protein [Sphingobacterium litopenaei]